jgi:NADPH-dependent 2,4-dienoyl-CoA reductase/sulfur reductase-like enzyme
VGKESLPGWLELTPAEKKKKVMVIGGGPAGLETARVAKSRGHDVSLWERGAELGGMTLLAAKPPGRAEFGELSRYYTHQMKLLNVDVHLNSEVTLETVKAQNPDVVVVATGSKPMLPTENIPGLDQENVIKNIREVLAGQVEVGQNVLIVDHQRHIEGLATADFLAQQGKAVEVIFPLDAPAENMERITRMALRRRLAWGGVKLTPRALLKAISGNSVTVTDPMIDQDRVIEGIDTIILSYGGVEDNDLYYLLKDHFPEVEVYAAGDCKGVRKTLWAVHDGAVIGRAI